MPVAVAEFQGVLAELARRLGTSLTQLLAVFDQLEPAEQYAFITDAYPDLLLPYLVAVGEVSAQFYAEQPTTDDPALFVPEPAVLPEAEALAITGRWALTTNDPLASLIAAATKALYDQSRDTVLDNVEREGVKWARYASSTACGFCRMLATRGAVYTSEAAAGSVVGRAPSLTAGDRRAIAAGTLTAEQARANRSTYSSAKAAAKAGRSVGNAEVRRLRGNQQHGEKYHRNCRCMAVAVRAGDTYEPPAYVQQWEQDYQAARKQAKAEGLTNERGVPDPAAIAKLMDSAPRARRDPVKQVLAEHGSGGSGRSGQGNPPRQGSGPSRPAAAGGGGTPPPIDPPNLASVTGSPDPDPEDLAAWLAAEKRWNSLPPEKPPGRTLVDPASVHSTYNRQGDTTRMRRTLAADDWRYIADPADRATAMLQYKHEDRQLVERVAVNIGTGREPFAGISKSAEFKYVVQHYRKPGLYEKHDYRADLEAAAARLIRMTAEDRNLGVVYRGINLPAMTEDRIMKRFAKGKIEGGTPGDNWSFASATKSQKVAYSGYARHGTTRIVYEIRGAHGADLNSVGKMFESEECILNGQIRILEDAQISAPDPNDPDVREVRVVAEWVGSRFPMTTLQ